MGASDIIIMDRYVTDGSIFHVSRMSENREFSTFPRQLTVVRVKVFVIAPRIDAGLARVSFIV